MKQQLPKDIHTWLSEREISDSVLERYDISFSNNKIVIPVHGIEGDFLFNKYRRNPSSTDGPKYQYEKGATSVLYGIEEIPNPLTIVITEGELDTLCLVSHDISAVSSTGGAGTFDESWQLYFTGVDTYICYDNDDAGIKGAFHVQSIIPWAKIILLPKEVKDVTDYFVKLKKTREDFIELMKTAKKYELPRDWKESKTKKEMKEFEKEYSEMANGFLPQIQELGRKYEKSRHLEILKDMYVVKYEEVRRSIKYFSKGKDISGDRITRAKAVPITNYINFNVRNLAKCVWHNDKNPSLYLYEEQSRVKCFSCGKLGDVIDVVMQIKGINMPEAIKIILNEK